jgi:hypothetical protein
MNMSIFPYTCTSETEGSRNNTNNVSSAGKGKGNLVQVKWLGPDEPLPHVSSEHTRVIHVEALSPGSEVEIASKPEDVAMATIYVCYAGEIITVTYGREEC